MNKLIKCPDCGELDQTTKVSAIYIAGIEQSRSSSKKNSPSVSELKGIPPSNLAALSRRLKPPASGKQTITRPVHPDSVILIFSLVVPFFVFGIGKSQPIALVPVFILLAGFYGFYFWKRKSIIAKFDRNQADRKRTEDQVKMQLDRWMRLYYCARDDGVFEPGSKELIPADQMSGYLLKK